MRKKLLLATSLAFSVLGALPLGAQTAPSVAVRAGTHEDFDRVVFDWPHTVKFEMHHEGDHASITFDADATLKFSQEIQANLRRARGFSAHTDGNGHVTVSFAVSPNATLKTFTSSTSVVVDISGKEAAENTLPAAPAVPAAKPEEPKPSSPPASATPVELSPAPPQASQPDASPATTATDTPQPLLPATTPSAAVPVTPPAPQTPPKSTVAPTVAAKYPLKAEPNTAEASKPTPVTPPPPVPVKKAVSAAPAAAPAPVKAAATVEEAPNKRAPTPPPPAPQAPIKNAVAPAASAPLAPPVAQAKKPDTQNFALGNEPTLVLTLDPHIQTHAAIYQRADVGYIVFDRKMTLTAAALENGLPAQVDLQPLDLPKNSGFRFSMPPNADLHATLDGTVWKIYLSKKQAAMPVSTVLIAQPDFALGARFLLPLPDAPDPIRFTDPVVGDDLILVPLAQSEAFNTERHTADLIILPAAQGLVIKPLTDKVIVRSVSDGIEVTAEGGLLLSRPVDTGASQQSPSKARAAAAGKSIFDFATWAGKQGETFTKTRQRLQQTIVDVPEAERNRARLELARFYFAQGQGEEAISLLNLVSQQVPDLRLHGDFISLLGASEILAYRSEDGLRDLSMTAIADQPEIELWQAVGYAQLRDWPHAEEKFAVREPLLTGYPEPFFSRFFVMAIESALAVGKDHEAADWLDFVTKAPHQASIEPALSYLGGVMHAKAGRAEAAKEAWKQAQASNDRLYKIRAELALIDLGVATASLTPAQAADRLEALRFGWRGDDLEVEILHRLAQFYVQAKNVKAGLNVLSQAVHLYPASPLVPTLRTEMLGVFHDVFLGDLGKKLSPLDSLTLYQQYRDLMPSGKDGDLVMRNLSERLVAVDLLDQAASLLEDLAKNRLQGEEKDRAALRLAAIRLLDHKPTEASAALDLTGNDALSASMQTERTLLRARTLSELHRDDEAAALLKDNNSPGAKMLRADIAMHGQQWSAAAAALMELAGGAPPNGTLLSTDQAGWLINAAIAYALANDQAGLDKLAIDYTAAMAATPQNDTFLMLTRSDKTGQLRDLAAAQAQISQVDMFQGFLNNYRTASAVGAPAADTTATKKP